MEQFHIALWSGHEEWWRCNVFVLAGLFDAQNAGLGFRSFERIVAPVGCELEGPPEQVEINPQMRFSTEPADRLSLYIYVVPHSLPPSRHIDHFPSIPLYMQVKQGDRVLTQTSFTVNPWGGASIEWKYPSDL